MSNLAGCLRRDKISRGLWSWQGSRSFLCRRKCPRDELPLARAKRHGLSKGGGTIEYSVAYQQRALSARRISEAMRFFGLDRQEGHPWLQSSHDCSALYGSTCYYISISLNRTPTNSGKPPLPFGLEKQAYRVLVAVIVRTSAFLEWQQSLCLGAPSSSSHCSHRGLGPESGRDAGLSKTG